MATGRPPKTRGMSSAGRDSQSIAFFKTPGIELLYSGVIRIVDVLRDKGMLDRLRRIHCAFGEALRSEQMCRELDWLLYEV